MIHKLYIMVFVTVVSSIEEKIRYENRTFHLFSLIFYPCCKRKIVKTNYDSQD